MDTRDLSDTCLEDKDRKRQRQRHWERFNDIVTIVTQLTITDKLKNSYHDVEGYRLTVRVTWTAIAFLAMFGDKILFFSSDVFSNFVISGAKYDYGQLRRQIMKPRSDGKDW